MTTKKFRAATGGATFDVEVDLEATSLQAAVRVRPVSLPEGEAATVRDERAASSRADATSLRAGADVVVAPDGPVDGLERILVMPVAQAETRALVVPDATTTWVFIDGEVWTVDVEPADRAAAARRPRTPAGAEALMAPMPATVIRVLVEPGRDVRRGDTLLLLEAMKMELPVRAPRDGRVTALRCEPGQLVQPGVPLVDLA